MSKTKFLVGLLIVLCILFVIFQFNENELLSCISRSLIIPVFTLLYFQNVKRKSFYFSMFLILYSVSELTSLISDYIPYQLDYFMGNGLYIAAYVFLVLEVLKSLNFNYILNNYSIHLIVLGALNIYIIYVLLKIVYPFVSFSFEFGVELLYNIVMLLLLSVSLLNYFYRDDKKSLLMFVGSLCLVFSEVILVAYLYISEKNLLIFSSSILSILAFYFFYSQASLKNGRVKSLANL
ncbi:MAG TPA: hypothetical protein VKN14_15190 [Flavobacteriaceae bacterium]|nr:hypothetical protein [Flavobacteriaceae bacterium]